MKWFLAKHPPSGENLTTPFQYSPLCGLFEGPGERALRCAPPTHDADKLIHRAPVIAVQTATRANQPSRPREKEGEPCRVWEAIESIPGRLAPCRVENGGGRGNCSVKLGRVNMHVGSRSAAIGLDHARSQRHVGLTMASRNPVRPYTQTCTCHVMSNS